MRPGGPVGPRPLVRTNVRLALVLSRATWQSCTTGAQRRCRRPMGDLDLAGLNEHERRNREEWNAEAPQWVRSGGRTAQVEVATSSAGRNSGAAEYCRYTYRTR
ncbi:MAG: hypothetical protein JWR30_3837 [Conexibacter sp.]|nr:hypothetical protein [Conexibacter sp.]